MSSIALEWAMLENGERLMCICRNGFPIPIANEWLLQVFRNSISPKTSYTYAQRLVVFFRWIDMEGLTLDTITKKNLYDYRDALEINDEGRLFSKEVVSESTKAQTLGCALRFINWLLESKDKEPIFTSNARRINSSFLRGINTKDMTSFQKRLSKRVKKKLPKYLTDQELEVIRSWINDTWVKTPDLRARNTLIFDLLLSSGVRLGELCSIKLEDIYDDQKMIHIGFDMSNYKQMRQTGNKRVPLTKTGERMVVISDRTVQLLNEYVNLYRPREAVKYAHGYLFCNHKPPRRGEQMTSNALEHMFDRMNRPVSEGGCAVNKKLHAHLWRHTTATSLTAKGANSRAIQEQLGHRNPNTTAVYTHLTPETRRQRLDDAWRRDLTAESDRWEIEE